MNKWMIYFALSLLPLLGLEWLRDFFQEANYPPVLAHFRFVINLIYLNIMAAFYLCLKKNGDKFEWKTWLPFLCIGLLICLLKPIFSVDLYSYLMRGRILGVYGLSPYAHAPSEFPLDPMAQGIFWQSVPEAYGPISVIFQTIPSLLFPHSQYAMVLTYKLILVGFFALSIFGFSKILQHVQQSKQGNLLLALALNPLIIISVLLDGHNDIIMLSFALLSFWSLLEKKWTWTFVFWTCAFLTKLIILPILPLMIIVAIRQHGKQTNSLPILFCLKHLFINSAFILVSYGSFSGWEKSFSYLAKTADQFYSNSLPYLIQQALYALSVHPSDELLKTLLLSAYILMYILLLIQAWKWNGKDVSALARLFTYAFLGFFTVATMPFNFWYLLWALPWLILARFPHTPVLITLYSFVGIFAYFKRINFLILLGIVLYVGWIIASKKMANSSAQQLKEN